MNSFRNYLKHAYASEYYDPVKAHEYYMKNRQLKGRRSTKGFSDEQKSAWDYTKNNIQNERRAKIKEASESKQTKTKVAREKSKQIRTNLSAKLKQMNESITDASSSDRKTLQKQRKEALANLTPIPKGISKEKRAQLMEIRRKEREEIYEKFGAASEDISKDSKEARRMVREDGSNKREEIRTELSNTIQSYRDEFDKIKEAINSKYDNAMDTEHNNISTKLPGKVKKEKKAKKGKSDKKGKKGNIIYFDNWKGKR